MAKGLDCLRGRLRFTKFWLCRILKRHDEVFTRWGHSASLLPVPLPIFQLLNRFLSRAQGLTPAMMRLSMNELTTFRWSFDEDVHHYRRAGYEALGVWRRKLADFGEERAIELLLDSEMAVSNLIWAGGFTGNDGRSLRESLADAHEAIQTAYALKAGCLVLYTGGRNNHTQRHAKRLVYSVLEELVPMAQDYDVTLAIEPMHPACGGEWTILSCMDETLNLIADFDSPHLKIVYDSYHFPKASTGNYADLSAIAPLIAIAHLGDWSVPHGVDQERCPLGEGHAELEAIIHALIDGGFDGDFDVELFGAGGPDCYEALLRNSRNYFNQAIAATGAMHQQRKA